MQEGKDDTTVHQQQHESDQGCEQKLIFIIAKHQANGPTNVTN